MLNMKKTKKIITTFAGIGLAALLLQGCMHDVKKEKQTMMSDTNAFQKKNIPSSKEAWLERLMNRNVEANFVNASVFYAVSQVAKTLDIPLDTTFRPSSLTKITVNYKGTLEGFLSHIYYETGVKYKYRNGMLKVFNKKEVEREYKIKSCRGLKPSVVLSLDNTIPAQVFKTMSQKYGMDFTFDTRMISLSPGKKQPYVGNVNFYYKGCDKKQALRKFARSLDLSLEWESKGRVKVKDYEMVEVDIPTYFDYEFTSSGGGIQGSSGGSNSGSGGSGGSVSGNTISKKDNFKESFTEHFSKYLSTSGILTVSNRGYGVVTDRPSVINTIKRIVRIEKRRQTPIALSVAIIRVDVKNEGNIGVDWTVALNNVANALNLSGFTAGINMANKATGGLSVVATKGALSSMVNALQVYGKSKIVRDFNSKTRSGILSTFKAVDQIPYVTSSVVSSDGVAQVSTEAKIAEAGLIVNIIPTLTSNGEAVNLATNISVSEYNGDKEFNVNGGTYTLPKISTNSVQMPVRVRLGTSIVLTGFKLSKAKSVNEGIPGASQVGGMLGGLFGHAGKEEQESEFLIVITPKRIKDF